MFPVDQLRRVPRAAWFLGLGLTINSFFSLGPIGNNLGGIEPIGRDPDARLGYLDPTINLHIWFRRNVEALLNLETTMLFWTIFPASLHLIAGYLAKSSLVRNLSILSAFTTLTIIPHTYTSLIPTAAILVGLVKKGRLTSCEENGAVYHIGRWNSQIQAQALPVVVSWIAGLGALLVVSVRGR